MLRARRDADATLVRLTRGKSRRDIARWRFLSDFHAAWFQLKMTQAWFWLFLAYTIPAVSRLESRGARLAKRVHRQRSRRLKSDRSPRQLFALMCIVFVTGASTAMVWPLLMIFLQTIFTRYWRARSGLSSGGDHQFVSAFAADESRPLGTQTADDRRADRGRARVRVDSHWVVSSRSRFCGRSSPQLCRVVSGRGAFVADIAGEDVRGGSYGLYTFAYFLGRRWDARGRLLYDNTNHAMPFYLNTVVLLIGAVLVATCCARRGV